MNPGVSNFNKISVSSYNNFLLISRNKIKYGVSPHYCKG